MNKFILNSYGDAEVSFTGKGTLKWDNGVSMEADLLFEQKVNGDLLFIGCHEDISILPKTSSIVLQGIEGVLADGRHIRTSGDIFLRENSIHPENGKFYVKIVGRPQEWKIGHLEPRQAKYIDFKLTNFFFIGDESKEERSRMLTIDLAGRIAKLIQAQNYERYRRELSKKKSVRATASLRMDFLEGENLDEIISIAEKVCDLLSFMRGTLVSWNSCSVFDHDNNLIFENFRDAVTKNLAGWELISRNDSEMTKKFIENGFNKYLDFEEALNLRQVARQYIEVRGEDSFLQTRAMNIGILVEYISSSLAPRLEISNYVSQQEFNESWPKLKKDLKRLLKDYFNESTTNNQRKNMVNNAQRIYIRPIDHKIRGLLQWLNIEFEFHEVNQFVNIRNSLAHHARFPKEDNPITYYLKMLHLLDRIIMGLFNYHGRYDNVELKIKK